MKELEQKLRDDFGISFLDPELLKTAFTHSSYANENRLPKTANNERLEFLGDAALQLVISDYLCSVFPDKLEGELSKMRSSIVRSESLAAFSKACGFDQYVLLGNGEEKTGGRMKDAILEDLFEAFLGALMADQGFAAVKDFIYAVIIPSVEKGSYAKVTDYKTALQEALQTCGETEIEYTVVGQSGPAHNRRFSVAVFENGQKLGEGSGKSKKLAEQRAAEAAIKATKEKVDKSACT